jgi:pyrimidine-nucleoside phosphorylase
MRAVDLIARKRDRRPLSADQWRWFVHGFVRGEVPDYQMAAMLMAVRLRGLSRAETFALTEAMASSGDRLDLRHLHAADKHSTGGVGDKVTLVVAPLVAACGVPVAKMSGRGLAHTGGTVDKLESLRGFRTALHRDEFLRIVEQHGLVLAGQSESLAPADAGMYALRDVTATVDSIPLIAASIMSKKLAVGAETILLDVKVGSGAFMKTLPEARRLARLMVQIGRHAGRRTAAVITDMDEPLGRAVGHALELKEAVAVLRGAGPPEVRDLCLDEAAHLLALSGHARGAAAGRRLAEQALMRGEALAALRRVVVAQGGDPRQIDDPELLPRAPHIACVRSPRTGFIARIDALAVGRLMMTLGAARAAKHEPVRHDTGVVLRRVHGDQVSAGEPLAEIHAGSAAAAEAAAAALRAAVTWSDVAPPPRRLVIEHINA